jgi:hypothetical protein
MSIAIVVENLLGTVLVYLIPIRCRSLQSQGRSEDGNILFLHDFSVKCTKLTHDGVVLTVRQFAYLKYETTR